MGSSRGCHDADSHLQVASEMRPFVMCTATCLFTSSVHSSASCCGSYMPSRTSAFTFLLHFFADANNFFVCWEKIPKLQKHKASLPVHVSNMQRLQEDKFDTAGTLWHDDDPAPLGLQSKPVVVVVCKQH